MISNYYNKLYVNSGIELDTVLCELSNIGKEHKKRISIIIKEKQEEKTFLKYIF